MRFFDTRQSAFDSDFPALAPPAWLCQSIELWVLRNHTLTFLSAVHARLCTLLAVIHLMFRAFLTTCPADLCTKGAELFAYSLSRLIRVAANAQMSAQSRSSSMHRAIIFTSSSRRQAAAHISHTRAQFEQAWMQEVNIEFVIAFSRFR